jgi:endonuclease I
MKKTAALFVLFLPLLCVAQPQTYYTAALGKNGQALIDALYNIIKNHQSLGYSALWTAYQQTDKKPNGKVWDMYSDNPGSTPAYEFSFITDQCGNYNKEGDCFNREHSFPQSYFNKNEPMRSDLFIVFPTDGYVNGKRSNYPYGIVNNPTYISSNGSKLGNNQASGAPSSLAFEPIDSFKGDLARTYFYTATRYLNEDNGWSDWEMANGASLKPWAVSLLLAWHHSDPVSSKEINRNNAAYQLQNNRNPFIDYPQFADCIWGNGNCASLSVEDIAVKPSFNVYPNPTTDFITIDWQYLSPQETLAIDIINLQGQVVLSAKTFQSNTVISTKELSNGVYILYLKSAIKKEAVRLIVQ